MAEAPDARREDALQARRLLRAARMAIAKELSVPPYVVFPDTTLVAFATERPTDREALLSISGVGQSKLERYGDAFLKVIREFER
ncbi:MAG: HRDC domain-containing protein, partial [Hoeflea sp.]|nr:HRDC domain-containing protein [Hoeflea sp.]